MLGAFAPQIKSKRETLLLSRRKAAKLKPKQSRKSCGPITLTCGCAQSVHRRDVALVGYPVDTQGATLRRTATIVTETACSPVGRTNRTERIEMENIYFKARLRAFNGHGRETIEVMVDPHGTVRVWDTSAHAFTVYHDMADCAIRRLRRIANEHRTNTERNEKKEIKS